MYCIYPLVVLFGAPEKVQASAVMLESGVDGEGSMLLSYEEMDAVIQHSKIASSYLPAEIQGELATMVIDKINQPGEGANPLPRRIRGRFDAGAERKNDAL